MSKKALRSHFFVVDVTGRQSLPLHKHNADEELAKLRIEDWCRRYVMTLAGADPGPKDHTPLTKMALERNFVALGTTPGNFTFLPKGAFVCEVVEALGKAKLREAFRCLDLKVPPIFRPNTPALKALTDRFGIEGLNRMVAVSDHGSEQIPRYFRYAGDPEVFHYLSGRTFDAHSTPALLFSHGDTARNDFELAGLIRTFSFFQPCHHIICDRALFKESYLSAHGVTTDIMRVVLRGARAFLNVDIEAEFLKRQPGLIEEIHAVCGWPMIVRVLTKRVHYYSVQHQYCVLLSTGHSMQVGNLQVDFESGMQVDSDGLSRFDIGTIGESEPRKPAAIIHGVASGRSVAALAAMLDVQLQRLNEGPPPALPLWAAPNQLRLIPMSHKALSFCREVVEHPLAGVRAVVDGRDVGFRTRLRAAETDMVPLRLIVGDRDLASGEYQISTSDGSTIALSCGDNSATLAAALCRLVQDHQASEDVRTDLQVQAPFSGFWDYGSIPQFLR